MSADMSVSNTMSGSDSLPENSVSNMILGAIKKDCSIVHMVCDAVSRRAAHMCAAGVAAIATKIHANRPDEYLDLTCGVDGSVYKKHPTFSKFLQVILQ